MTNEHLATAEKKIGPWTYKALQTEEDMQIKELQRQHALSLMQTGSDPICNSVGCTQYLHPKDDDNKHPMNYPVPNFGIDRPDVATTSNSLEVAESMYQHRWILDPNAKKAEDPVKYNTEPVLDEDIINTQAHSKLAAEKFMVKQDKKEAKKDDAKKGEKKDAKKD